MLQNIKSGVEDNNKEPERSVKARSTRSKKSPTAFRTISEVATILDVQQHVLRFWETKFSQVKPLKRGGGRRYYRPEDVALLSKIHHLLYTEGYTIKGVQKLLKGQRKQQIIARGAGVSMPPHAAREAVSSEISTETPAKKAADVENVSEDGLSSKQRSILEAMLGDLKELRDMVKSSNK